LEAYRGVIAQFMLCDQISPEFSGALRSY